MVTNSGLLPAFSSGDLNKFLAATLQKDLTGWTSKGTLLRSYGTIINLNHKKHTSRYSKYYGVVIDADGPLEVDAEKHLLDAFQDGDFIELIGYPIINIFKGSVNIRLELVDARLADNTKQQAHQRNNQAQLQQLFSLKKTRNPFPISTHISIDLIHSAATSAWVDQDFYQALGEQMSHCKIQALPIRITSAQAIVAAINQSKADVLVIIRGGGPDIDFTVFNDQRVLEALANKQSYRVIGIGHSANSTLLDLIADYTAAVPAEAGRHIRDQLEKLLRLVNHTTSTSNLNTRQTPLYTEPTPIAEKNHSPRSEKAGFSTLFLYLIIAILIAIILFW